MSNLTRYDASKEEMPEIELTQAHFNWLQREFAEMSLHYSINCRDKYVEFLADGSKNNPFAA